MIVYVVIFEQNKGIGLSGPVNKWEYVDTHVYQGKEHAKRKAKLFCNSRKFTTRFNIMKREVEFPSLWR